MDEDDNLMKDFCFQKKRKSDETKANGSKN